ncbi:phosphotransferase family protein [Actinomadura scrupuli]|uniref:phosphotransferase family protein n=1 Tax=Actinomadura scrupuli TaxID=559629 RepID=UPI003D95416E
MGTAATDLLLTELVRRVTGNGDAWIASLREERFEPSPGSAATGGLRRLTGTTAEGQHWSFFVKSINSPRHWPHLGMLPEGLRAEFIAALPWRAEAEAYRADVRLPEGLRMPRLHLIDDLGDDRLDLWLEDVESDQTEWELTRYDRAAHLLGGLAARNPAPPPAMSNLRGYVQGRIVRGVLPELRDPALWQHPLVAPFADARLRADLLALGERIPELLDAADRLPHTMVHGDSSPHNLLVTPDGEFVALDWGWYSSHPVGFDLGQLLVGLAHEGLTPAGELPALHATIEAAYLRGLAEGGGPVEHASAGYRISLVLRSAFTAIPAERLAEPATPELTELCRRRIGLARFLTDLGHAL